MHHQLFSGYIRNAGKAMVKAVCHAALFFCWLYAFSVQAQQTADGPFVPQKSMIEFRALTADPGRYPAVYITDAGRNGMFRYDGEARSQDEDEGVMTLVTANNKRYTRVVDDHINVKWFGAVAAGNTVTIEAVYRNLYGGRGFAMAKRLYDAYAIGAPYQFDNAMYTTQSIDWFALQTGLNYCIKYSWETTAQRQQYKTLYVPAGVYILTRELFAQKFEYGNYRHVTFAMVGEAGYYNGTVLRADFSKNFALGIQLGYHCRIENISFTGQFGAGRRFSDREFFHASQDEFKKLMNPGCADGRFGPYGAIVIDPFFYGRLQEGPSMKEYYWELKECYRGEGYGGSTKIEMNRIYIEKFVAGIVCSPNGYTANNELMKMENISLRSVKCGIVLCQAQEKTNVIKHLSAWGDVHTVIVGNAGDNKGTSYGAGTPGQWSIEDVDLAGRVNQFIYRRDGAYFPLFVRNLFSESLGRIGTIFSQVGSAFEDCEIGFYLPTQLPAERDQESYSGYHAQWQLEGGGYTFKNCAIRFYKNEGWPVAIAGNFKFENCVFETVPYFSQSTGMGQPQFFNCHTHNEGGFGNTGIRTGTSGEFSKHVAYGKFVLRDFVSDDLSVKHQFAYEAHLPFRIVGELPRATLQQGAANGDVWIAMEPGVYNDYYRFAKLVLMYDPANEADKFVPLGIIKSYDPGRKRLLAGGVRPGIPAGVTIACMLPVTTINPFLGDLERGRSAITNVKLDAAANNYTYGSSNPQDLVGKVLLLNHVPAVYSNYRNYTVINGYDAASKSFSVSGLAVSQSVKSVYFCNGCEKQREQKSPAYPVTATEILQRGSRVVLNDGLAREYRVVQSGFVNAAAAGDARQAQLTPDANYTHYADARFYGDTALYFRSVHDARSLIPAADRKRGMSVLALNGGVLEEYWFYKGTADADLVKKSGAAAGGTPGGGQPGMQSGTLTAGPSSKQSKIITLNFNTPFQGSPRVILTSRNNAGFTDVFTVNTLRIGPAQAEVLIYGINCPKGWKQDLKVDWWAFE